MSEYEARQALQELLNRYEQKQVTRRGLIGDSNGNVSITDRPGWAYIRYRENLNELSYVRYLIQEQLPDGTPVRVGKKHPDDPFEQVLGVDWAWYAYTPAASTVTQYATPAIDLSDLSPGKVVPTVPASLSVDIRAFLYRDDEDAVEYGGGTLDLTANVPGVAGHRLVLVYMDLTTNLIAAEDGTIVAVGTGASPPAVPEDGLPLGLVDLENGETTIEADDITQYKAMYQIIGETTPLALLEDYTRGYIIRGGAADWEAYDASGDGYALIGDSTDINSDLTPNWKGTHTWTVGDDQGIIIEMDVGQSVDAMQLKDSGGDVVSGFDERGIIFSDGDTVSSNFFAGSDAGNISASMGSNTGVGYAVLQDLSSGYSNTGVGGLALTDVNSGTDNSGFGYRVLYKETNGDYNTVGGSYAAYNQNTAGQNTIFGSYAGYTNLTGARCIYLGYAAGYRQTASDVLIIDNRQRANIATEQTHAIVFGTMGANPEDQQITFNVDSLTLGTDADADVAMNWVANSNSGVITWMEDEDYFESSDSWFINASSAADRVLTLKGAAGQTQQLLYTYVSGGEYLVIDSNSSLGLNVIAPGRSKISVSSTTGNESVDALKFVMYPTFTANGNYYANAQYCQLYTEVDNGVTVGGQTTGVQLDVQNRGTTTGVLGALNGLTISVGMSSGTPTTTTVTGIGVSGRIAAGTTATTMYHIVVSDYVTGGTLTSNYGLRISDMTAGTNNWAIRTYAGNVEFNANQDANTDLRMESIGTQYMLFVDSDKNAVLVGSNTDLLASLGVRPVVATDIGIAIRGVAAQSAALLSIQDSGSNTLSGADERGILFSHGGTDASNFFAGTNAGNTTATLDKNIGIGTSALASLTIGYGNVGIGQFALVNCTEGFGNFALGTETLDACTIGYRNVAIGEGSLTDLVDGFGNVGIGASSGENITDGTNNVLLGYRSGRFITTTNSNVAIGDQSISLSAGAAASVCIGERAGRAITGNFNVCVGYRSGYLLATGASNVFLGPYAGYRQNGVSSYVLIDNQLRADAATELTHSILYGTMAANPEDQQLTVNADALTVGTDAAVNVVMTWAASAANGILTWDQANDRFDFSDTLKTSSARIKSTTEIDSGDSPYTTTNTDDVVFADTDGGAITINLQAGVDGRRLRIINCGSSGNDVTIDGDGAENVRGAATQTVSDGEIMILVFETTQEWW